MAVYLIDFENVRSDGLNGIDNLKEQDRVCIFYSANAEVLTFDAHKKIILSKADIQYFRVRKGGKNALDFQLSSYLGYLINENRNEKYYIISNDRGFNFVMDFWISGNSEKLNVFRIASIDRASELSVTLEEEPEKAEEMQQILIEELAEVDRMSGRKQLRARRSRNGRLSATAEHRDNAHSENRQEAISIAQTDKNVETDNAEIHSTNEKVKNTAQIERKKTDSTITVDTTGHSANTADAESASAANSEIETDRANVSDNSVRGYEAVHNKLNTLLANECPDDKINILTENICTSDNKQELYRLIIRMFGQKKGIQLYKLVRAEYSNMRKIAVNS